MKYFLGETEGHQQASQDIGKGDEKWGENEFLEPGHIYDRTPLD